MLSALLAPLESQPSGNGDPNDHNNGDNSLLTPKNSVKGEKTLDLEKAFNAKSLLNQPGVYAIRCKLNNIHYIGESQNLKNRIPKHKSQLTAGKSNKNFLDDFNKYGAQAFELIIVNTDQSMEVFQNRLNLQTKLQSLLIPQGLCYNTGFTETKTPRPSGEFPTDPGVYCIRCKINNACYFGETQQRRGLAARLQKWRSNLRQGIAKNQKLQSDWNLYGEDAFEFMVVESGSKWLDQYSRLEREYELIDQHYSAGGVVYNFFEDRYAPRCHLAAKETILRNQTPEYREFISELNKGRPNENKTPLVAEGQIFLSYMEAASLLKISRRSVRLRVRNGRYSLATEQQVLQEKERRLREGFKTTDVKQASRSRSGESKPVIVHGKRYSSISEAAEAYSISPQAMSKRLQKNTPGHFYADSDEIT